VFDRWAVARYAAGLGSRRFVILADDSGTGKARIAAANADSIGAKREIVPVAPRLKELPGPASGEAALDQPSRAAQPRTQTAYRVVGIFSERGAITGLVGAIGLEQNDERAVQRARYMTLETITTLRRCSLVRLPDMAA
jgi:hypothetical protein